MKKKYDIVTVLWLDHVLVNGSPPKNPDTIVSNPTLTVGFLFEETALTLCVMSSVEPYSDSDQCSYTVILKGTVIGIKRYGKIKLRELR